MTRTAGGLRSLSVQLISCANCASLLPTIKQLSTGQQPHSTGVDSAHIARCFINKRLTTIIIFTIGPPKCSDVMLPGSEFIVVLH
ncbi:hypothetical protein F5X97DRAFT_190143 [Nemania serpens]|nr:hypothetical protein F5X97DRAFT_190143 [Nemania serpens]